MSAARGTTVGSISHVGAGFSMPLVWHRSTYTILLAGTGSTAPRLCVRRSTHSTELHHHSAVRGPVVCWARARGGR